MVITVKEMRVIETNCVGLGIPLRMLMEAAGASVARVVEERISPNGAGRVVVLAGKGGNGGDALVAARYLSGRGYTVAVVPAYPFEQVEHPDTRANLEILKRLDTVEFTKPGDTSVLQDAGVIIDGLLGTGVRGELREPIRSLVVEANRSRARLRVAIDTPTGLNPDTGEIHGIAFKADVTVTFHDVKPGLLKKKDIAGEIVVANIGVPRDAIIYAGPGDVIHRIPQKPIDAHKGVGGRILVVGGSIGYTGAPALVAAAALAAGADLAFLAVPASVRDIIASYTPEIITYPVGEEYFKKNDLPKIVNIIEKTRPHVVVVGNGIGREEDTLEFVRELIKFLIEKNIPMVIDADGLKAFKVGSISFKWTTVLTPHRGEYKSLTGETLPTDINRAIERLIEASKRLEATILLKAPIDMIIMGEKYKLNKTGNPGMSIGGTGDVLAGIVAAFLARTRDPFVAAYTAAYINGLAGDYLVSIKKEIPSPTRIIEVLPLILSNPLETHLETYIRSGV